MQLDHCTVFLGSRPHLGSCYVRYQFFCIERSFLNPNLSDFGFQLPLTICQQILLLKFFSLVYCLNFQETCLRLGIFACLYKNAQSLPDGSFHCFVRDAIVLRLGNEKWSLNWPLLASISVPTIDFGIIGQNTCDIFFLFILDITTLQVVFYRFSSASLQSFLKILLLLFLIASFAGRVLIV